MQGLELGNLREIGGRLERLEGDWREIGERLEGDLREETYLHLFELLAEFGVLFAEGEVEGEAGVAAGELLGEAEGVALGALGLEQGFLDLDLGLVHGVEALVFGDGAEALAGVVDEGDERDEAEVAVDLVLVVAELGDVDPAHGDEVEVALVAAALHEHHGLAQRVLQVLQRLAALGPLLEVRQVELLQQVADQLQVLSEALEDLLVHARVVGRLHHHRYQLHRVHSHQLPYVRHIPHRQPWHPVEETRHWPQSLPLHQPSYSSIDPLTWLPPLLHHPTAMNILYKILP
jgi:hypothetical protein